MRITYEGHIVNLDDLESKAMSPVEKLADINESISIVSCLVRHYETQANEEWLMKRRDLFLKQIESIRQRIEQDGKAHIAAPRQVACYENRLGELQIQLSLLRNKAKITKLMALAERIKEVA